MQKTLIIGDIHGCYQELQALLDKAGLGQGDAIIAIGDVVDRGPETPEVVAFFQQTPNTQTLMGNHERKHLRAARHEVRLSISQKISQIQLGPQYPAALEWMAGLPLWVELEDALLVHGYFEPGVPLEMQNPMVLCGTMGGEKILHERYERPWYELYAGKKPIIVGHENYSHSDQPFVYQDRVFGLDTNCVTGKALTGLLLPAFQFVSVPSRGNLWMRVRRAHPELRAKPSVPRIPIVWSDAQNQRGELLLEKLKQVNRRLMAQLEAQPGFVDLPARQQARLYTQLIGPGHLTDLLQLARLEKLDMDLIRKMIKDEKHLRMIFDMAVELEKEQFS